MSDLISRQQAITSFRLDDDGKAWSMEDIIYRLEQFPSAQPERKTGRWIGYNADRLDWQRDDGTPIFIRCSECFEIVLNNGAGHWNFCPNCGADMRGKQDE